MNDPLFLNPRLVELFDSIAPWERRPANGFYMPLIMSAKSALDVGCGTGELLRLARKYGHTGRLCGVDPAEPMLQQARKQADIEWVLGDAATGSWDREFDLVIMTGHAIQVIIDLDEIRASLAAIRSALSDQGRFVFETRNPLVRDWETWMPDQVLEFTAPDGTLMRKWHEITSVEGEVVSYQTTYTSPSWAQPVMFESSQRFIDRQLLSTLLSEADLVIEKQFGDWNRQPLTDKSPEIITIAGGRPRAN